MGDTMPEIHLDEVSRSLVADAAFSVDVYPEGDRCVAHVSGDLDLATRNHLFVAATAGNHEEMVIDLHDLTFMDCSGYGALVACRLVIERAGRALTIRGLAGQPEHLVRLIERIEQPINHAPVAVLGDRQPVYDLAAVGEWLTPPLD